MSDSLITPSEKKLHYLEKKLSKPSFLKNMVGTFFATCTVTGYPCDVNITNQIRTWKWRKKWWKCNLFLRFTSGIQNLPIDPFFSSWVHVIKKES